MLLKRAVQGLAAAVLATAVPAWAAAFSMQEEVAGTAHEALFSIAMDGKSGFAAGVAGTVMVTGDGGASWHAESVDTPVAALDVAALGAHRIVVGQMGLAALREPDGTWAPVETGTQERLLGVAVNERGMAVAVGSFGAVLRSDDGGRHWSVVSPDWSQFLDSPMQPHLYDVHLDARGVATVVGELGLILRSEDGGASWNAVRRGVDGQPSLFALQLPEGRPGYAVGQSGTVLRSEDGGLTWTALDTGVDNNLLGVWSTPDGSVVVPGIYGLLISRDHGRTWTLRRDGDLGRAWYSSVAAADGGQSLLAVGHSGRIVRLRVN